MNLTKSELFQPEFNRFFGYLAGKENMLFSIFWIHQSYCQDCFENGPFM